MSTKVNVQYSEEKELQLVIKYLNPVLHRIDRMENEPGKRKKARITLKNSIE